MVPEIVDRLAAMLDYNLEALVGPRCQELNVKNPEKYKFNPRQLLGDLIDVFLNLSDQGAFARAVAEDGRSYRKELFEQAAHILQSKGLKSADEVEKLRLFVLKVEETKATIEAEEDLGEIPDEFLGERHITPSFLYRRHCLTHYSAQIRSCTPSCGTRSLSLRLVRLWTDRRLSHTCYRTPRTRSTVCPSPLRRSFRVRHARSHISFRR